jgi:hypothetical protein
MVESVDCEDVAAKAMVDVYVVEDAWKLVVLT